MFQTFNPIQRTFTCDIREDTSWSQRLTAGSHVNVVKHKDNTQIQVNAHQTVNGYKMAYG